MWFRFLSLILAGFVFFAGLPVQAADPVDIKFTRPELEQKWRARIQSSLDRNVIPFIDLESSLKCGDG